MVPRWWVLTLISVVLTLSASPLSSSVCYPEMDSRGSWVGDWPGVFESCSLTYELCNCIDITTVQCLGGLHMLVCMFKSEDGGGQRGVRGRGVKIRVNSLTPAALLTLNANPSPQALSHPL